MENVKAGLSRNHAGPSAQRDDALTTAKFSASGGTCDFLKSASILWNGSRTGRFDREWQRRADARTWHVGHRDDLKEHESESASQHGLTLGAQHVLGVPIPRANAT